MTDIQHDVMMDRYALYGEKTWEEIARRIANALGDGESETTKEMFYSLIADRKFIPGGRIIAGAGGTEGLTPYNCFVIPSPRDSRNGIMESVTQMVEIMSRGGGVGVNLSTLRPKGALVKGVNGTSSGPVSWADIYSTATGSVIQGGTRRGALMIMLDDWHPDIEEFINVKRDMSRLTNANLSICVSDKFMEAVENGDNWKLYFPQTDHPYYNEWDGNIDKWLEKHGGDSVTVYKTIPARDLWQQICEAAWASGEPGVVFMERVRKESNTWYTEWINCVNPCGEQPLGPWGVCNLGAMNLAEFVLSDGRFNMDEFKNAVHYAIRMLDNVIDMAHYFIEDNEKVQKDGIRRIGLGTMGLADALIKMKIRYGSQEAIEFTELVFSVLRDEAYRESVQLARERGSFGLFDRDKYLSSTFIQQLPEDIQEGIYHNGIRNAYLLTQAPTGSTSLVAGVSSGIEPVFAFEYTRKDRTGTHVVRHPLYQAWKEAHPDEPVPDYFVTADQLTPEEHVRMQAAAQKYIDSSISKTVNAPQDHTVEDVDTLYRLAYQLGCKGVTYYRDGSRDQQVLYRGSETTKANTGAATEQQRVESVEQVLQPIPRPTRLYGYTERIETPLGNLYATLNVTEDGQPFELFAQIGKAGSDVTAFTEGLSRIVSLALRTGIPLADIVKQLEGIGGSNAVGFWKDRIKSIPDAIGKFLQRYKDESLDVAEKEVATTIDTEELREVATLPFVVNSSSGELCPQCGSGLALEEGCRKCYGCGYSAC